MWNESQYISENQHFMENVSVSHSDGRGLLEVTENCVADLKKKIEQPDLIMFFPGNYPATSQSKKEIKRSLQFLKKSFPDSKMCGGVFCGSFSKKGFSIRGATLVGFKNIIVDVIKVSRPRIRSSSKGKKVVKKIKKMTLPGNSNVAVIFSPGAYFPPMMVNQLKTPRRIHIMSIMNSSLLRRIPFIGKILGKLMGLFMDLFNIGFPLNSFSKFLDRFNDENIPFVGALTADPLYYSAAPVFVDYKLSANEAFVVLFQSSNLEFGISVDTAISYDDKDSLKIQKYIPGGFITEINEKWGKEAYLEKLNIEPSIYYKSTRSTFFFDIYHPLVVDDPECDYKPLLALAGNPNLKSSLHTGLDSVIKRIVDEKAKVYVGYQSARDITSSLEKSLDEARNNITTENICFGMVFECVNRMMVLGDQFRNLVDIDNDFFGKTPYIGLVTGGELISKSVPTTVESVVSLIASRKEKSTSSLV